LASLNFVSSVAQLEREETLIFYTDGVTEARRGSEFFGLDRLQQFLTALPAKTPSEVVPAIFNKITQFTAGNFKDDIALLALSLK
jgi:sigma-B regulation protein RsbU (phosphoserine phosphatase)